jgi:uncharacterized membrane protein YbhN (UPF0104 family)
VLAVLLVAGVAVGLVLVGRALWSRLEGLWQEAKQGGTILGQPSAYLAKVVAPSFGSWLCKLGVIAVFLAAYGIPVSLHTVMTVAGGNSLANVVSVTPGGAGVNQAVNSATLSREGIDRETAFAYSAGQQLVTTAWSVSLAILLVAAVFGWAGGKHLVGSAYQEAKQVAPELKRSARKKSAS